MAVGRLGSIRFSVSDEKIASFNNLSLKHSVRTATHEVQGSAPLTEYIGPDNDELTLTVELAVLPDGSSNKTYRKLKRMMNNHVLSYFLLGGKRIGSGRWMITDMSNSFEVVNGDGKVMQMSIDLTLKAYA